MAESTGISWATSTFNPWIGCTRVSPGCDHCYAEALATRRMGVAWGPHAERRRTRPANWRLPLAWNRKALESGQPWRVFCSSLADVFDNKAPEGAREDLWELIHETPALTWMLLTKRPQNIARMLPTWWGEGLANVWLGTTVENQAEADRRVPVLLAALARLRFLSCEPLLGPVDLSGIDVSGDAMVTPLHAWSSAELTEQWGEPMPAQPRIEWVIAGGESGPGARPMHPDWARSLRDQCAAAGVPFHFKQWGEWREFDHGPHAVIAMESDSDEAKAMVAGISRPGFVTQDGQLFASRQDLPLGLRCRLLERVGTPQAGHLLDGVEHQAVPG